MTPACCTYRTTLGVVYYRCAEYDKARRHMRQSLHDAGGSRDAFDLFFLAMCHHQLGDAVQAKDCYGRAVRWLEERRQDRSLPAAWEVELAFIQAEAATLLNVKIE
jgi:uncharacterized protein HemY